VHKAKGLEFPVVVLCDVTCSFSSGASRHIDPDRKIFAVRVAGGSPWELIDHEERESERDRAESLRLLYVAATRARDILVVPVVADEPHERGWVGPLLPALYPSERAQRLPMVPPLCPRFHYDDTVIDRSARSPIQAGIRPGLHRPERGGQPVVWWDPTLLERATTTKPGLRRHWILQAGADDDPGTGAREYAEWERFRDRVHEVGGTPSFQVASVTRLVELETPEVEGTESIRIAEVADRDFHRPTGKRFGTLVHEVLARASLNAGVDELRGLATSIGRLLDNSAEEIEAAVAAASSALAYPLLERARTASLVYRETPLLYRAPDGRLVEGIPDLVFRESSEQGPWTLVDFKTDLRPDVTGKAHRAQVALYRLALMEAKDTTAEGWILYV
jgi:ATP-dependent helicase/nuclease subunit A